MKTLIFLLFCFSVITLPAFGALTDADLDKIRLIVKEEVKTEVESSEKRMQTYIDTKIDAVNARIDGVEKQITLLTNVFYGLIALIVAAIAIPQSILAWQNRGNRSLEKRIEALTQEVEVLKRQQIVRP